MGNVLSSVSTGGHAAVVSDSHKMSDAISSDNEEHKETEHFHDVIDEDEARAKAKEEDMVQFRKQLDIKREQRRQILARHKSEKLDLEKSLESERKTKLEYYESNRQLRELLLQNGIEIPKELESPKESSELAASIANMNEELEKINANNIRLRRDLVESNMALQTAYSDIADLTSQNTESIKHISALKEVVSVSKTMIGLREQQLNELKNKLNEIERSFADRESRMLSADLRQEYERQLQNIRTLRGLYEERARLAEVTRQGLARELDEQRSINQAEINKCKDLKAAIEDLEQKVTDLEDIIENKKNEISSCQDEARNIKAEMSVVNKLFSQVLLGYKTKQDLDKLVHRLEENHGLLTHMAERENDSEASSALPKLLLELVSQVDEEDMNKASSSLTCETETQNEELLDAPDSSAAAGSNASVEEIVENLPKVWRVLIELLSHQSIADDNPEEKVTTCYKSVETKSGPVLVPSVSQTYIRLKDLIVEKLALIKEVNRMKQLNTHLETRLGEQERRLCLVTNELSKTWHVVGRLRRHHHQLHTHEKILKYELQQKRKLLNELKEELEYCREKWEQAREKNSQSEKDLRKLRTEFSNRKIKSSPASVNNSAESGYSDERPSDDSSESNDEYRTEPLKCKKKIKKSFETIIDSSSDINLAAEREDPASDMIDVADLPLDTHDSEDNVYDSFPGENCGNNEKLCEDISNISDGCNDQMTGDDANAEESSIGEKSITLEEKCKTQTDIVNCPIIDPSAILNSIKQQNERLAVKDKKLEDLEKNSTNLLEKTKQTLILSEQINTTLEHIINRPSGSNCVREIFNDVPLSSCNNDEKGNSATNNEQESTRLDILEDKENEDQEQREEYNNASDTSVEAVKDPPVVNFQEIIENIKLQNDRLAKKENRLHNLEAGCSEVVNNISNKLVACDEIIEELDAIHARQQKEDINPTEIMSNRDISVENTNDLEPSTSSDVDHEARFAARDIRLRRLEEQTKSLVNKVNNTATKGVKIHYKLEELHNIYGSENSRASTPNDENEETSESNDPQEH